MAPAPGVCGECSQGLAVSTTYRRARQRQGGVGERQRPAAWPTRYTVQIRGLCPACIYGSAAQIAAALRAPACIYAVYWGHGGSTFHALQLDRLLSCVLSRWIVGPGAGHRHADMPHATLALSDMARGAVRPEHAARCTAKSIPVWMVHMPCGICGIWQGVLYSVDAPHVVLAPYGRRSAVTRPGLIATLL